jgi:DNA-binding NtrC family response regulator
MASILVVDDDVDTGDLLADLLREGGHDVRVARDGHEGYSQLQINGADLVVLDVEMPVLTGPEMAYAMFLHNMGLDQIPVVLLSGALNLRKIAEAVGTPYFVGKPCSLDALLAVVDDALAHRVWPHPNIPRIAAV